MTTPTRTTPARWAAAVLLVLPALVAVVLIAGLTYGLNDEYGMLAGDATGTIFTFAVGVAVTSLAVVPFTWFAVRIVSPERARRHVWLIVLGSIGLVAAVLVAAGLLGQLAHSRGISNAATGSGASRVESW
jgi:hypothetical protein